jgi:hypothetical protein
MVFILYRVLVYVPTANDQNRKFKKSLQLSVELCRMEGGVVSTDLLTSTGNTLEAWDYVVIVVYFVAVLAVGLWVSQKYFLSSSLISSNFQARDLFRQCFQN